MADDPHKPNPARTAFFTDLNELQSQFQDDEALETALSKAIANGFAFQLWVDREGPVYYMAHHEGHSLMVRPSPDVYERQVLAGLLGLPSSLGIQAASDAQASPAVTPPAAPAPSAAPSVPSAPRRGLLVRPGDHLVLAAPAAPAASAASATPEPAAAPPAAPAAPEPEAFDLEEDLLEATPADPDPEADPSTSTKLLTEEQKTGLLSMLRALPAPQSKAAIVAFRKAFSVPAGITKPGDAITEVRHLEFLTRFIDEAEGITAP